MSMTIKEALERASFHLKEGIDAASSRREAAILLAACLGVPSSYIYAHGEEKLSSNQEERFERWLYRRSCGEPFAYLCGNREFMGLRFEVTPAVLIPRPETELLVEELMQALAPFTAPQVLEVGTGSGAVAVALAVHLPQANITACDVSVDALEVAARNVAAHSVQERVKLVAGDVYAPVTGMSFDAVVSNPPYIPAGEIPGLPIDVRQYEPLSALDGGRDGLSFYRRLTGELSLLASLPSLLAFEVGSGQAPAVEELCRQAGYGKISMVRDLAGIERVVIASGLK